LGYSFAEAILAPIGTFIKARPRWLRGLPSDGLIVGSMNKDGGEFPFSTIKLRAMANRRNQ